MNPLTILATRMARAAAPYLGDLPALELANNVASFAPADITEGNVEAAIQHRVRCFGLACGDVTLCAEAIVTAAKRHHALAA